MLDISKNIEKTKPLLDTLEKAYDHFKTQDYDKFLNLVNLSWEQKRKHPKLFHQMILLRKWMKNYVITKLYLLTNFVGQEMVAFF